MPAKSVQAIVMKRDLIESYLQNPYTIEIILKKEMVRRLFCQGSRTAWLHDESG